MVITYLGASSFKVQFGDLTIAINPVSKASKLPQTKYKADIALVSLQHPDWNGVDNVTFGDTQPFAITGPGEYELKDVVIQGLLSHSSYDGGDWVNTIYTVSLEGMTLCFLGGLDTKDLPKEANEKIAEVDVVFVPIAGEGVLSPALANQCAAAIEPKLIVPTHYTDATLKAFLKEAGENPAPVDKLTLKRKDLEGKEGDVIVLASQK
jgi:L-ascorbate metabolism protein UlaG (beta-lactamase superfamily)